MGHFKQGLFTPKNPDKYIGDIEKIRYMSSWELSMHSFLDNNAKIIRWCSEELSIPYIKPTDNKIHKYYPDYYVEYIDKFNNIRKVIIEVKPDKQTKKSRARSPKNKLYEDVQYAVNVAKWSACKQFCDTHGLEFQIVTEKQMFR
jgi:hypothetical protein